jgi:acyl-CoA synthetase (AMP-forming)/AMP-acid ligase II
MGLNKGDRVALLARNSFRYLEINLACARAGLILVPLNFRLSEPEIARILQESGSTVLLRALPFNDAGISALAWADADPMGADTP